MGKQRESERAVRYFITFCGENVMNDRMFHQSDTVCMKLKNVLAL